MTTPFRKFPRGRLNATDEGEVAMGVTVKDDVVIIAFPYQVTWIGLPAEQAEELAETLKQRAQEARRNRQ
jgi:hypothetical protein